MRPRRPGAAGPGAAGLWLILQVILIDFNPTMPKSPLQLPEIAADGRKQAECILESLESRQRVRL